MKNSKTDSFRELIDALPNIAVQGYNRKREVIYWNKTSETLYGYTKEEALGQKLENLIIPDMMREEVIQAIAQWIEKGIAIPASELDLIDKAGNVVPVYSSHVLLDQSTKEPEMFCLDIDISQRKASEALVEVQKRLLEELNRNLEKRVKEEVANNQKKDQMLFYQSKMAAMGEMIGNIAHQWRQPLNIISLSLSNVELMYKTDRLTEEELDRYVSEITTNIHYLSDTIDDFRHFFHPDKEKYTFLVEEVIAQAMKIIDATLKVHHIECDIKHNGQVSVHNYKNELEQILINIINNAKDAIIETRLKAGKIIIEISQTSEEAIIAVTDNGGGVPEPIREKIFDPYFTTKFESQGTGLGLYMSKMIIEKSMGGHLEVSNKDDGACFTLYIPKQ